MQPGWPHLFLSKCIMPSFLCPTQNFAILLPFHPVRLVLVAISAIALSWYLRTTPNIQVVVRTSNCTIAQLHQTGLSTSAGDFEKGFRRARNAWLDEHGISVCSATGMVSAPWEPYPERKRKLEEKARRPKNKNNPQHWGQTGKRGRRKNHHPATDSSVSSSSSEDHARAEGSAAGYDTDSAATSRGSHGTVKGGDGHARVRPDDCWCLRDGGCGDEDGCCAEDLPGAVGCPCFSRISPAGAFEVRSLRTRRCQSVITGPNELQKKCYVSSVFVCPQRWV